MGEPRALVEHFFRHEFGRLVAVLTRSLGVRRLDLVEDVVQAALVQALETWSRRGVPEDPAGWLYRTARNLAIDALRRERTHAQALPRLRQLFVQFSADPWRKPRHVVEFLRESHVRDQHQRQRSQAFAPRRAASLSPVRRLSSFSSVLHTSHPF